MTNVNHDMVGEILQDEKFTIVNLEVDPDTNETSFIVVHDLHPEDEVEVRLVSKDEDGEDSMQLQFSGPDSYTDEEAKVVLHEVMEVILKIIDKAIAEAGEASESGSGSASTTGEGQ